MKKSVITLSLAAVFAFASSNTAIVKQAYNQGIYDTLKVLKSEDKFGYKQSITLNGWIVYIKTGSLTLSQIVKYKALALKLAFTPIETSDGLLIFAVNSRRPDAFMNAQIIANNSNLHPEIKKVEDYKVTYSGVLQRYFKSKLPDKVYLIEEQKIIKPYECMQKTKAVRKNVFLTGKVYLINRVLSPKAVSLYCNGNPHKCGAKINFAKQQTLKTVKKIKHTLGKINFNFKGRSFDSVAGIISRYGIVKDGKLYVGKKMFVTGNKIGDYYLLGIFNGRNGAVVVEISPHYPPKSAKDIKRVNVK